MMGKEWSSRERVIAASPRKIRELQQTLVRGTDGPGTLLWPWHDLRPDDLHFEAANHLAVAGIWCPEKDSLYFRADQPVTRRELATSLVRLYRVTIDAREWPEFADQNRFSDVPFDDPDRGYIEALALWGDYDPAETEFKPEAIATWGTLNDWLGKLKLPTFPSLVVNRTTVDYSKFVLTRDECVDFLYRLLKKQGESFRPDNRWLQPQGDDDGDGKNDYNDALPFDRDNVNLPDRLQPPNLAQRVLPFGRCVLVSDYGGDKVAIVSSDAHRRHVILTVRA